MTVNRRAAGRLALGAVIGAFALWAALREVTAHEVVASLGSVRPGPAALALLTSIGAVFALTRRWQLLFAPDYSHVSFWQLFRSLMIGQMLNIASPVRIGEMSRLYLVHAAGVPAARVLATLAVEKAFEVAVFALAALLVAAWITVPSDGAAMVTAGAALLVAAVAALSAAASRANAFVRSTLRAAFIPDVLRRHLVAFCDAFAAGLRHVASVRLLVQVALFTVAALALPAMANQLLLIAFDIQAPLWTGLALLVVLQIGSVPPSLPGRLGVFNYLTVVTLESVGVDKVSAASYSIALYIVAYGPKLLLGSVLLAMPTRQPRSVPVS